MTRRVLSIALSALALAACREPETVQVYQAVAVEARDIIVSAQAAGVIEPDTTVEVKSKASGEILDIRVQTGERVDRGTLLVRIDQRIPYNNLIQSEASLEVARARLANAEAQKRRADELFKSQAITEAEHDAALLDFANAKAEVVRAEVDVENDHIAMDDTDVRAPIGGTVIAKDVERGQVISSPNSDVAGGTVLLTMADLTLVQVRTLVDETDIGKIRPGMPATVTVASYPNQPFRGEVLKIEPQAVTQQNVTMFPVLVRIENLDDLLKPGMNAEVEISIGRREGVLAVPFAALRTERDVGSAAAVLGLTESRIAEQLATEPAALAAPEPPAAVDSPEPTGETITLPNGATVALPPGVSAQQVEGIMAKRRAGEELTEDERGLMRSIFQGLRGGAGRGQGAGQVPGGPPTPRGDSEPERETTPMLGGDYVVFVLRQGEPTAIWIRTGLSDLDYSEVLEGLTSADSVLLLPNLAGAT